MKRSAGIFACLAIAVQVSWAGDVSRAPIELETSFHEASVVLARAPLRTGRAEPDALDLALGRYDPYTVDPSHWVDHLRNRCRPLDWAQIAALPARVIYLGEYHYDSRIKPALAANMSAFRGAGITDFGYEGFSEPMEPYFDGRSIDAAGLARITAEWDEIVGGGAEARRVLAGVLSLISPAAAQGIRLHRLDMTDAEKDRLYELCEQNSPACPRDADGIGTSVARMAARDERMASAIVAALDRPDRRMVALVGAKHAMTPLQPRKLARYGRASSLSLLVLDSTFVADVLDARDPNRRLLSLIDEAQPGSADLFCPLPAETALYDGVIVLRPHPQPPSPGF